MTTFWIFLSVKTLLILMPSHNSTIFILQKLYNIILTIANHSFNRIGAYLKRSIYVKIPRNNKNKTSESDWKS